MKTEERKTLGLSITVTTIVTLVLVMLLNSLVSQNYNNLANSEYILIPLALIFFLAGIIATAITSKTKHPLTLGLASSTISIILAILGTTLVSLATLASLKTSLDIIAGAEFLVQSNILMMFSAVFLAGLGSLAYWYIFSRNKEASWAIDSLKKSLDWKRYVIGVLANLGIIGAILLPNAFSGQDALYYIAVIASLGLTALVISLALPAVLGKFSKKAVTREFLGTLVGTGILVAIGLVLGLIIFGLVQAIPDIVLLGALVSIYIVAIVLVALWMMLFLIRVMDKGVKKGLSSSARAMYREFPQIIGRYSLAYVLISTIWIGISAVIAIPAFLGASLPIEVVVAALGAGYIYELGVLVVSKISEISIQ